MTEEFTTKLSRVQRPQGKRRAFRVSIPYQIIDSMNLDENNIFIWKELGKNKLRVEIK